MSVRNGKADCAWVFFFLTQQNYFNDKKIPAVENEKLRSQQSHSQSKKKKKILRFRVLVWPWKEPTHS